MNAKLTCAFLLSLLFAARSTFAQAPPLQVFMFAKPPAAQFNAEAIPDPATNRLQTAGREIPEMIYLALAADHTTIAAATEDTRLVVLRMIEGRPFLRWIVPFFGVALDVAVGGGMVVVASHIGLVEILTDEYLTGATNVVPTLAFMPTGAAGAVAAVKLADMNGDGRLDVVIVQTGDRARIVVVLADPVTGRISPTSPIRVSTAEHGINPMEALPGMNSTDRISVGVSNMAGEEGLDDDVDLVAVTSTGLGTGCTVEFLENGGGGSMEPVAEVPVDPCPRGVLLHEFTGDDREDLVRWYSTSFDSSAALAGGGYGDPVATEVDGTITSVAEGSLIMGLLDPMQQGTIDYLSHVVAARIWAQLLRFRPTEPPDRVTPYRRALAAALEAIVWLGRSGLFFRPIGAPEGPPNRPPVANAGPDRTILTDGNIENVRLDASASTDPDGDPLRYEWSSGNQLLSTEVAFERPFPVGTHIIRLIVTDSHGLSSSAVLTLTVNESLETAVDEYSTPQDRTLTVAAPGVLANDTNRRDGPLRARLEFAPTHGQLELHEDGSFTYIPNPGFSGTDVFIYIASNGGGIRNGGVRITVVANRPPTARINPERAFTVETNGPTARVSLHGRDSTDPDGDPLTYRWSANIGSVVIRPDITPLGEGPEINTDLPVGTHEVFLDVADGRGGEDGATLTVQVVRRGAPPGGNTPGGSNIEVQPLGMRDGSASVQFAQISEGGNTTIEELSPPLTPPTGFVDLDPPVQVDVRTTAGHAGPVEVCLSPEGGVPLGSIIVHGEDGAAVNRTSRVGADEICAVTSGLSPFAIFRPVDVPTLAFALDVDVAVRSMRVRALSDPAVSLVGIVAPVPSLDAEQLTRYAATDGGGELVEMTTALKQRDAGTISARVQSIRGGNHALTELQGHRFIVSWTLADDGSIASLSQSAWIETATGTEVVEASFSAGTGVTKIAVAGINGRITRAGLSVLRMVVDTAGALRVEF